KVLYLSKYFKDLILLGIYDKKVNNLEAAMELPDKFLEAVYTSQRPILKDRWKRISFESLRPNQEGLGKRIVGGEVWMEDKPLGPASALDWQSMPQMQVLGAALVEKKASKVRLS